MKIVCNRPLRSEGIAILNEAGINDIYTANDNNPAHYLDELRDADVFIIRAPLEMFTAEMIAECRKLKVIARAGVGYDMIDVKAASSLGIPVIITPGANARSVAEHALAMMLVLSQNLVESHIETLKGNWNIRESGKTFELMGKTAGIIGTGAIGQEAAKLCAAIGMKVLTCNSRSTREELEALLRESDVVSLHVPLTDKTCNMISARELSMMKPSAILINCARGGIVDEEALVLALNNGIIAGAGIDVFEHEPPESDSPLLHCANVIVSPHSASLARESAIRTAEMCARGCVAVLRGEKWPYVADKSVYKQ